MTTPARDLVAEILEATRARDEFSRLDQAADRALAAVRVSSPGIQRADGFEALAASLETANAELPRLLAARVKIVAALSEMAVAERLQERKAAR